MKTCDFCNLCGAEEYKILYPAGVAQIHQIVECANCGLLYANPQGAVDVDDIVDYDPEWILNNLEEPWMQMRINKEKLQVKDYETTKKYLDTRFENKGDLLEIGSGYGFLSNYFRDSGWNVTGLEPNKGLSTFAKKELQLNSLPYTLEESDIADNSFDVILMMHVIEHLGDPLSTLKLARQKLKSNGMFILETPRYDTLTYKLLKKRERSLSCDGHIYFFTSKTLKDLCLKAGFEVEKMDYVGRSLSMERLLWNLGVISKSKRLAKMFEKLSSALNLNKFWFSINVGDMQRIYLVKCD